MSIKAIVCDMDGTLLNSEGSIDSSTSEKLIDLQHNGVKLILASGRSYIRLLPDALSLQMEHYGGRLIDVNGSSIYNVQTEQRQRIGIMNQDIINDLNAFFQLFDVEIQYSQDATIYTYLTDSIYDIKRNIRGEMRLPDDYPWTGGMHSWLCDTRDGYPVQIMVRDIRETPTFCNKISIVQEPAYMNFVRDILPNNPIWHRYEYVFSDERKLEITNKGITKGNALNILLENLDLQQNEIAVFGDSENDISMFEAKEYSFAMENALPIAKEKARFTTSSNNDSGIYHTIQRLEAQGLFHYQEQ